LKINKRAVWKILKLPLLAIPCCILPTTAGLIVITVIGGLDDAITKWQIAGHWWIILVIGYILTLIYFLYEPIYRRDQKIKKYVSVLILFWEAKLLSENKPEPPDGEIEYMRNALTKKVKRWISLEEEWLSGNPGERSFGCPFDAVDLVLAEREKLAQLGVLHAKG